MNLLITTLFFGWLIWVSPVHADFALTENQNCSSCHRFSAEDSPDSRKAPDLFYAGNKFQKSWLLKYLESPVVIRKAGTSTDPDFLKTNSTPLTSHPILSRKKALVMVDYLMSLSMHNLTKDIVDDAPLSKGNKVRIKILFERNYGCIACHEGINLAGKARGGISGPSLANAGNRLSADWVFNWLKTPKKFITRGRMPIYNLDDESATKLTKYIMSLKIGDWN